MRKKDKPAFWTQHTHLFRADTYECSRCGAVCKKPLVRCPSCGADMTRTKYDPSWVDEAELLDEGLR